MCSKHLDYFMFTVVIELGSEKFVFVCNLKYHSLRQYNVCLECCKPCCISQKLNAQKNPSSTFMNTLLWGFSIRCLTVTFIMTKCVDSLQFMQGRTSKSFRHAYLEICFSAPSGFSCWKRDFGLCGQN